MSTESFPRRRRCRPFYRVERGILDYHDRSELMPREHPRSKTCIPLLSSTDGDPSDGWLHCSTSVVSE
jgi:hypothetical protein